MKLLTRSLFLTLLFATLACTLRAATLQGSVKDKSTKEPLVGAKGNVIGNGDAQFVFKGKQTLKKGTYTLKGWVYIADGPELTIEPGTVIKGDKTTKSALIVERGGKLWAKGTQNEPIVFTSGEATGNRRPGDWGGIILCGKGIHNAIEAQIEATQQHIGIGLVPVYHAGAS